MKCLCFSVSNLLVLLKETTPEWRACLAVRIFQKHRLMCRNTFQLIFHEHPCYALLVHIHKIYQNSLETWARGVQVARAGKNWMAISIRDSADSLPKFSMRYYRTVFILECRAPIVNDQIIWPETRMDGPRSSLTKNRWLSCFLDHINALWSRLLTVYYSNRGINLFFKRILNHISHPQVIFSRPMPFCAESAKRH